MSKELLFRAHNSQDTPYIEYSAAEWESILYQKTRKPSYPKLLISILKGIPSHLRAEIWSYLTRLTLEPRFDFSLKEVPCNLVLKDACRTFPLDPNFKHPKSWGQKGLLKVLGAYSRYDSSFEYCQGMNYIAGFLLMHLFSYEDAFKAFVYVMTVLNWKEVYLEGTPKLLNMLQQLDRLIELRLKDIHLHLAQECVDISVFSHFFFTVCVYKFPLELSVRVFDMFLLEGEQVILNLILRMLEFQKDKILKLKYFDLYTYLNNELVYECHSLYSAVSLLSSPN